MVWTYQKQKILRRGGKNTQNYTKKIFMTQSISVPELFPEMRALQSPGNSLFPASSVGKGLLPKGMSVTESEAS